MAVRDRALPAIDRARSKLQGYGLRRYAVTLRRRVWSGMYAGDGTVTNQDIVLTPTPRVRNQFSSKGMSPQMLEYILQNGPVILDRLYTIDKITPSYTFTELDEHEFGSTTVTRAGGYHAEHLRMRPNPDVKNIDPVVILVGDDGYARECVQLSLEQDRAFGYKMLVKETDRPRTQLRSMAITPVSPTVASGDNLAITSTGTFEDGATSNVSPICLWSSSDRTIATVDLLGTATGVAPGSATITATLSGVTAVTTLTVT